MALKPSKSSNLEQLALKGLTMTRSCYCTFTSKTQTILEKVAINNVLPLDATRGHHTNAAAAIVLAFIQ